MATFNSNWDALAAAGGGGVTWQPLEVGDAIALVDSSSTVASSSTTSGLWTVTLNPTGNRAFWRFAWPGGAPSGVHWMMFIRFRDFSPPASQEDQSVNLGYAATGGSGIAGAGYQYITGGTTVRTELTLDSWVPTGTGGAVDRSTVTEFQGSIDGNTISINGSTSTGTSEQVLADGGLGTSADEIILGVRGGSTTQQTLSFRPEYALFQISDLT